MHWLLTRPQGLNQPLKQALESLGQTVSVMPALSIMPYQEDAQQNSWQQLHQADALLFTSINAVNYFKQQLKQRNESWPSAIYLAIGQATADVLAEYGHTAFCPEHNNTSEDLLALPIIQRLQHKRLLMVTGRGGRGVLEPSLKALGIKVQRLSIYQRQCNADFCWPSEPLDYILTTSVESWQCLLDKGLEQQAALLKNCKVIAGGERVAVAAKPYLPVVVATSPYDAHMLAAIQESLDD